jgi:hypothetical protein
MPHSERMHHQWFTNSFVFLYLSLQSFTLLQELHKTFSNSRAVSLCCCCFIIYCLGGRRNNRISIYYIMHQKLMHQLFIKQQYNFFYTAAQLVSSCCCFVLFGRQESYRISMHAYMHACIHQKMMHQWFIKLLLLHHKFSHSKQRSSCCCFILLGWQE